MWTTGLALVLFASQEMVVYGGVGVESNYTENAGWRCWWRRSFIRVTISRVTSRYLPRHGSHLLEQFPHRLAGGLSCHPASHPLAYLVLVDPLVNPTAAMCSEQIGPPGKSQGVLLGPECGMSGSSGADFF